MEQRVLCRSFGGGKVAIVNWSQTVKESPECQAKMLKLIHTERSFTGYKRKTIYPNNYSLKPFILKPLKNIPSSIISCQCIHEYVNILFRKSVQSEGGNTQTCFPKYRNSDQLHIYSS